MKFNQTNILMFEGRILHVNTAFPLVLEYFKFNRDEKLTQLERLDLALFAFVHEDLNDLTIQDKVKLMNHIFETYIYTEEDKQRVALLQGGKKAFDYELDTELIYSAFLQQYNIDLTSPKVNQTLSWQQFNALLDSLSEDTKFRQVAMYRTMKITDDMSDDTKEYVKKMKLLYSLDRHKHGERLTVDEVKMMLAPLDMPHKLLKLKELAKQGKLPNKQQRR